MPEHNRYQSTRQAWEKIWETADDVNQEIQVALSARSQDTQRLYSAYLPKDGVILEAGSGLGSVIVLLRRQGFKVVGMDYAMAALQRTHQYDPHIPLYAADVHKLPHPDNTLGAYLSFGVLEHFEHGMRPSLAEAYRTLRPGGVLVLTIPYPNVVFKLVRLKRRLFGQGELTDDEFYESAYTRRQLEGAAESVGFKVDLCTPTSHSFTFWGLGGPFRKPGYYETSDLAEFCGAVAKLVLPWAFNYMTLLVAHKPQR